MRAFEQQEQWAIAPNEFESLRLEYKDITQKLLDYRKHPDRQLRELS